MTHSLADVRAALVAKLAAVPGFGVVHDRERYIREESKFRALYLYMPNVGAGTGIEQVRGWWVRRGPTAEHTLGVGRNVERVTWTVRGFMALADERATETEFDGLIEAARDALRADPTLGGVCEAGPMGATAEPDGLQVVDMGPVMFCGVLCHAATLELSTWRYL